MADVDPSGSQPLNRFYETWHGWLHPWPNFGGGTATWVVWANMWLVTSLSFFLSFFCFLQRAPLSHFLTDRHDLYAKTRVSCQGYAFWRSDKIRLYLGWKPTKTSPKWARIGISQPNRLNGKIAIYRSPMKIFASISQKDWLQGAISQKNAKWGERGRERVTWPTDLPLYLGNG